MRRRECLALLAPYISDQLIPSRIGPAALEWGPKVLHEGILYGADWASPPPWDWAWRWGCRTGE